MNRKQFMNSLKKLLNNLPKEEIDSAVDYYDEFLNEVGNENEETAIVELGSPSRIAGKIISEFALKEVTPIENNQQTQEKKKSTIWIVLLAIFASPIALPLALSFIIVVLALIIVLVAMMFSIAVAGGAIALAGIVAIVSGGVLLSTSIPTAIFFVGTGLCLLSVGTILIWVSVYLSKLSYLLIIKLMAKFLKRSGEKNEK